MGKGGGGRSAPAGPSPAEIARAQIEAQRVERERLEAERNVSADTFLSNNPISSDFRGDIQGRSQSATENQLGMLGKQYVQTLDDIRQRQAGRGLGSSGMYTDLNRQAGTLLGQSRQDIIGAGDRRAADRITQQQGFLTNAANQIRGGTPVGIAESNYQRNIEDANKTFDLQLRNASTQDQRNQAYRDFESRRQQSAARFKESVSRYEDDALLAARAVNQPAEDDELNAGQFGTPTTKII